MKKQLISTLCIAALTGAVPSSTLAQGLTVGEELSLDFTKEMKSIEKINDTATPMQKHLTKGLGELSNPFESKV